MELGFLTRLLLPASAIATALSFPTMAAQRAAIGLDGGWANPTVSGQAAGGGYLTIRNRGGEPDAVIAVSSPAARAVEIHETTTAGGIARMRQRDILEIPANSAVQLRPGGRHLMLIGLKQPLAAGSTVSVTLRFRSGVSETTTLKVRAPGGGHAHEEGRHAHH